MALPSRDRPIHVLVVSNHWGAESPHFGGIFVDRQIDSLKSLGVRVSTFDTGTTYSPGSLAATWKKLRQTISSAEPDLVHARYGTVVATLSTLTSLPSVITFAGSDLLPGATVSRLRTRAGIALSNFSALRAKSLICVSEELKQALWWASDKAQVIPDGIDLDLFSPGSQTEARRILGWPHDKPIALMSAARDPLNKGLEIAHQAIEIVRGEISNAELHEVEKVLPADMPKYYRAADVLICASRQEGSPNVVKEALACNLPVVSSRVGDIPERLSTVTPSAIVERTPETFAAALVPLMKARSRCNGREAVKNLGLIPIARRVLDVYLGAIES